MHWYRLEVHLLSETQALIFFVTHNMTRHALVATRSIAISAIRWKGLEGLAEEEAEAFRIHPLHVGGAAEDARDALGDGVAEGDHEGACE